MERFLFLNLVMFCLASQSSFAQNEFFVKGDNDVNTIEVYVKGTDGSNPTLFVKGDMTNNQGVVQNESSEIEVTGDFANNANGTDAKYESTGTFKFSGTSNSSVSGLDGTTAGSLNSTNSGINQFYNLSLDKSSAAGLSLLGDINVFTAGILSFDNSTVVTTNTYALFVRNSDNNAITGHDFTTAGTSGTTNYVDGKLIRALNSGDYEFPIGDASNSIPVKLFNVSGTNASSAVAANVDAGTYAVGNSGYLYADIATHPGSGTGLTFSSATSNTPDGIIDQMQVDLNSDVQWQVDLDAGTISNYDLEVYPNGHDVTGVYNASVGDLRYLFKDGVPYTSAGVALSTTSYPSQTFTQNGYDGAYPNMTGMYKIENLSSFSTFRLGGVSVSSTLLPVELIKLTANGVDETYINVEWATATEINNEGFHLQRSVDGENFENIAWLEGAGNSNEIENYSFNDNNVEKGILYYYRLKQIDFNNEFTISYIVSAQLDGENNFDFNVYPNPAVVNGAVNIEISSQQEEQAQIQIYDMIGKLVASESIVVNQGNNKFVIENGFLSAGQYILKLNLNDKQHAKSIIVTK